MSLTTNATVTQTNLTPPPMPTKATVLVIAHADGFIQVFGDTHIQAKILNLPAASIENQIRLEDLIEDLLPLRYSQVFFPGSNLRATGNINPTTVADIQRIVAELEILYSIGDGKSDRYRTNKSKLLAALEA